MGEQDETGQAQRGRDVASHPLDPLSADELRAIVAATRAGRGLDHRHLFGWVRLAEPAKGALAAWRAGEPLARAADVAI